MEKRVQNKARIYVQNLKEDIIKFVNTLDSIDSGDKNLLIQHIYDCKRLEYSKEDFSKRKRVKNVVPLFERCCALRANHEQCTRRRKGDSKYCGTHIKGIPHGELSNSPVENTITKKTNEGFLVKLKFETEEYGVITLKFRHFNNPFLKYGIDSGFQYPRGLSGLLLREYYINTMTVNKITDAKRRLGLIRKNPVLTKFLTNKSYEKDEYLS